MGELLVHDKMLVVPGQVLATGMDNLPGKGTYRQGDRILASLLGLVSINGRAIKLIGLSGRYLPARGDTIIGKVIDVTLNGWRIEINSAYTAMLTLKDATSDFVARGEDLTKYFSLGDYIVAKIVTVTSQKLVDLTTKGPGLRKLNGGRIIRVNAYKVPRIIGKQGSMVSMIKDATGCKITVGQNGIIWLEGLPKQQILAEQCIRIIEKEAHLSGLTDRIKGLLEQNGATLRPSAGPMDRDAQEEDLNDLEGQE